MSLAVDHTCERIRAIPMSDIIEVVDLARDDPGVCKLWVGESDLPTPEFICDAAVRAMREGHTRYTYSRGIPSLREAIAEYHARLYGAPMDVERVSVTVGGMQAVMQTFQAVCEPGDEVVVPSPAWTNVFEAARIAGADVVTVPFRFGNQGWHLDLEELFSAVTPRTRVLVVNSPQNPTGWIMPREQMEAVLEFARRRGLWILADEVYHRLTYEMPRAPSFLEFCDPEDRVIATNTFSKSWAMTGWRAGWAVAPPSLGLIFENLLQFGTTGLPTFVQHGCEAAVRHGETFIEGFVARCRTGRDVVCDALAGVPGLRFERPGGTFYLMVRMEGLEDSKAFVIEVLREARVGLCPGVAFGPGGEGHFRICFGVDHRLLEEAMARLGAYLSAA